MPDFSSRCALFAACLIVVAGCQSIPPMPGASGRPLVIAHRGASAHAPENTLEAFALAARQGAEWFELDCRLTAGDRVIVFHDHDLKRYTGDPRPVNMVSFDEMRAIDVAAPFDFAVRGLQAPTLPESLALAKRERIGVYVEIKSSDDDGALHAAMRAEAATRQGPGLVEAWARLIGESGTRNLHLTRQAIADIRAARIAKRVVIQSFSPVICLVALREAPEIRTELLVNEDKDNPAHWETIVAFGRAMGVHGFNAHHESLTPERVAAFHATGHTVAAWTVNDPARMTDLLRMGVDAIITDKPDVARKVIDAR